MMPAPLRRAAAFAAGPGCAPALSRLIGNLRGFVYRRQHDKSWTMEFVSPGCRNLTGYDPHRFIRNESVAFVDLIAAADRARVEAVVRSAVRHRTRASVDYCLRAAHGLWVNVEDRFIPVFDTSGLLVAIEGVIDRAQGKTHGTARLASAEEYAAGPRFRAGPPISCRP